MRTKTRIRHKYPQNFINSFKFTTDEHNNIHIMNLFKKQIIN